MKITVNQKQRDWEENQPLLKLLEEKKVKRAAVWVNGRQLLNQEIPEYVPQKGDDIRILRLVGGG
ncbi:MAG TPA: sulfur carrier protein ThiS [Bacillota bacterium]|nr:MoaD/ThiS family protein [Bacteroidia bacterium]HPD90634.1 sulfur carrier protein ThiS [Bacillota bacterium]